MDENSLPTTFSEKALPYFQKGERDLLTTPDDIQLSYRYFQSALPADQIKGTIIIVSGRTEFMEKYAELIYDLKRSGYSILIYDHRGQGSSDRLLSDPIKGFVAHEADYVLDLKQMIEEVAEPRSTGPLFILANSMGGAIATRYLIENPNRIAAFAAISPMYAPALKGVPQELALGIFETVCYFRGQDYVYGQYYDPFTLKFDSNVVTSSRNRFNYALELAHENPHLALGAPTNQWTLEAIRMGMEVRAKASELVTPTLIFQASEESLVLPEAENEVQQKAKDAKLIRVQGAHHEILMERQELRGPTIEQILRFFNSHSNQTDD